MSTSSKESKPVSNSTKNPVKDSSLNKLFITNLSPRQGFPEMEENLRRLFEPVAAITKIDFKMSFNHQYVFAFAEFETEELARKVKDTFRTLNIEGRRINIAFQESGSRKIRTPVESVMKVYGGEGRQREQSRNCEEPRNREEMRNREEIRNREEMRNREEQVRPH